MPGRPGQRATTLRRRGHDEAVVRRRFRTIRTRSFRSCTTSSTPDLPMTSISTSGWPRSSAIRSWSWGAVQVACLRRWRPLAIASPGSIARGRCSTGRARRCKCSGGSAPQRVTLVRGLDDRGRTRARWAVRAGHLLAERVACTCRPRPSNERRWRRRDEPSIRGGCS